MAIKREVTTRTQIYNIYSSERQEQFEVCKNKCPQLSPLEEKSHPCFKECLKVYDDYSKSLFERYKENPEKLSWEVKDLPSYTMRTREEAKTLWHRLFS